MAIIALLTGMSLAVLTRVKQAARSATCFSNLRQLGLAAQLYWDDHDGRAFRYRGAVTNGGDVYWFGWIERGAEGARRFDASQGALAPYLPGRGIETCPALNYTLREFKLKATGAAYGYGYNLTLSTGGAIPAHRVQEFRNPSGLAVFADAAQINTFQAPASPQHPMLEEFYYINTTEPTVHFRHTGSASVLFLDGHVGHQSMRPGTQDERLPAQRVGRLADQILTGP